MQAYIRRCIQFVCKIEGCVRVFFGGWEGIVSLAQSDYLSLFLPPSKIVSIKSLIPGHYLMNRETTDGCKRISEIYIRNISFCFHNTSIIQHYRNKTRYAFTSVWKWFPEPKPHRVCENRIQYVWNVVFVLELWKWFLEPFKRRRPLLR